MGKLTMEPREMETFRSATKKTPIIFSVGNQRVCPFCKRNRSVMQFAEGIEPIAVEGGEGKIVPGQVVCEPLPQLPAGEQVTVKIKARADRGGTLQFRVEVTGDAGELRLVSEGASRFFADSAAARRAPAAASPVAPTPAPLIR